MIKLKELLTEAKGNPKYLADVLAKFIAGDTIDKNRTISQLKSMTRVEWVSFPEESEYKRDDFEEDLADEFYKVFKRNFR